MSGPKRIFAAENVGIYGGNVWYNHDDLGGTEYIRRDPAVLAALPEVQAMIAGAYEAAARLCWAQVKRRAEQVNSAEEGSTQRARWIAGRIQAEELAKAIEALPPADAIAARDAMIAEAVKAEREACAQEAEDNSIPGMYEDASFPFLAGYEDACQSIAAAIRKRNTKEQK